MKTISRTLAMIVSLQLAVGCEPYGNSAGRGLPGSETGSGVDVLEISGSIARSISNFVLPSAVAAEGKLTIYDASMPDDQVEIYSEEISGSNDYSIKIQKSLVEGRILKIRFMSSEGSDKNRDLLIMPSDSGAALDGSLSENSSIRSQILEQQLKVELGRGEIASFEDVKARFGVLKESSIEEEMGLLGDRAALLKMFQSEKYREIAAELLAVYRLAIEQENTKEAAAVSQKLLYYSIQAGVIKDGILKCAADKNSAKLLITDSEHSYNFRTIGNDKEVLEAFGEKGDFGSASDSEKSSDILSNILGKLAELSKKAGRNLSVDLIVVGNDKSEQSCTLYGQPWSEIKEEESKGPAYNEIDTRILNAVLFEKLGEIVEGQELLSQAYEVTLKDLQSRLSEAKVDPKEADMIFNDQVPAAKKLYESRLKELDGYFNSELSVNEIDSSILNNVSFEEVANFEEGQAILSKALDQTIEDLKKRLEAAKIDPKEADGILEEQTMVAKNLFELRLKELDAHFNSAMKSMQKK